MIEEGQLHSVAFIPLVVGICAVIFGAMVLTPALIFAILKAVGFSNAGPVAGKGRLFSYAVVLPCRTLFFYFLSSHAFCVVGY